VFLSSFRYCIHLTEYDHQKEDNKTILEVMLCPRYIPITFHKI
jgi:hypothetical protein